VATLQKPLSDHGEVQLIRVGGKANVDYKAGTPIGDVTFTLGVEGNVSVGVFNAANDVDDDGVFSGQPAETAKREDLSGKFEEIKLPPAIQFEPGNAWTRFRYEASPLIQASIELPAGFAFKLDKSKKAIFGDYHTHPAATRTLDALTSDIGSLRFSGDADHIVGLPVGDALSYMVRGVLETNLSFTWSDSFLWAISDASRFLGPGQSLALEFGPSVTVDFKVAINDDFRVTFKKTENDRIRVAVMKAKSQELGINLDAGISVGFSNPAQLSDAISTFLKSLVGKQLNAIDGIMAKIDSLVARATMSDFTDDQKNIVMLLSQRLGLTSVLETIEDVEAKWIQIKEKWQQIKDYLPDRITEAVKTKVKFGFKYEYLRLKVEEELAVAVLTEASLRAVHKNLMLLNVDKLLDEAAKPSNKIETYINQVKKTRRQAWGFTLGVGKWTILSGQDKREVGRVLQTNLARERRVAFDAVRSYEDSSLGDAHSWVVNLKAELNDFSEKLDYGNLEYGLHLKYFNLEKKIDKKELRQSFDYAFLWNALSFDELDAMTNQFTDTVGGKGEVGVEIVIGDAQLREIVERAAAFSDSEYLGRMAVAFARSLPYSDVLPKLRANPQRRERFYAPLWLYILKNGVSGQTEMRNMIYQHLDDFDQTEAMNERIGKNSVHFAEQAAINDYRSAIKGFRKGLIKLNELFKGKITDDWDGKDFVSAFKSLRDLWNREIYVRATGAFLLSVAAEDSSVINEIKRTATFDLKKGSNSKAVVTGAKALAE
jgi:hypothetical protein